LTRSSCATGRTASLVSPLPIIGCSVDTETPRDKDSFYTVVITNDILRPDWLANEYRCCRRGDAWCEKETFLAKGWQGCFAQAGIE
jgi:hypothetical protein